MPFDINYGPISTAMGLAQQAGQAQGTQLGFQDQQEMQRQLLAQQQASQQARAQDISLSLEGQRNSATQNLAQAQLANTAAYQQANLAQLAAYRQGTVGARTEQAGAATTRAQNQGAYQQGQLGVGQQNADTRQQAAQALSQYQQWEESHGNALANDAAAQALSQVIKAKLSQGLNASQEFARIQTLLAGSNLVNNAQQQQQPAASPVSNANSPGAISIAPSGVNPAAGGYVQNYPPQGQAPQGQAPQGQAPPQPGQTSAPTLQTLTQLANQLRQQGLTKEQVQQQLAAQFPQLAGQ